MQQTITIFDFAFGNSKVYPIENKMRLGLKLTTNKKSTLFTVLLWNLVNVILGRPRPKIYGYS